ncbi:MAG: TonB C-terminal domain-containing protein [Bacteriovoracaceae bacterium]|nr:TonB C-terminal domain-containing protein [Bacteriovoracaceae bacterium]
MMTKSFIRVLSYHLGLLGLFFLFSHFYWKTGRSPINFKTLEKIETAIRVDVVAMPKLTLQELRTLKEATDSQPESLPAEKIEPSLASHKVNTSDFKVESKFSKKDSVKLGALLKKTAGKKDKSTHSKKNTQTKKWEKIVYMGNQISKGSASVGQTATASQALFEAYLGTLPEQIKPYWKLPTHLLSQKLKCHIRLFISSQGEIIRTEIVVKSGDLDYDKRALQAIQMASPLLKPPEGIEKRLLSGDIVLGFPL